MGFDAEGCVDAVVVDDEVTGLGGDGLCLVGAWWSDDEGDAGVGVAPGFCFFAVDAVEVAVAAGGSEVVGVPPCSSAVDGDDVVDGVGLGGAAWSSDLAEVIVSGEDLFADGCPWSSVGGVSLLVVHGASRLRGG